MQGSQEPGRVGVGGCPAHRMQEIQPSEGRAWALLLSQPLEQKWGMESCVCVQGKLGLSRGGVGCTDSSKMSGPSSNCTASRACPGPRPRPRLTMTLAPWLLTTSRPITSKWIARLQVSGHPITPSLLLVRECWL